MLGRIAVEVVYIEGAVTGRKRSRRVGVGSALGPASAVTIRALRAAGRANASLVGRSIAPTLRRRILTIVSQSHATYRDLGSDAFCQLKGIIGRFQAAIACAFPFVRVAQPLALGLTQLGGFLGLHPYHRVVTGNIRELKLINAGLAVLGTLV